MNRTEQVESSLRVLSSVHQVNTQTPIKNMDNQGNLSPYNKTTGDSTNESRPEPVESPGLDIMPICSLK
jgi:hypothetical protein